MTHSINVLTEPPSKVLFSSKEEKDAYVVKEFEGTTSQRNWRFTCGLQDVTPAIKALADAQRHFAVLQGYLPSKRDKYILEKPKKLSGELA